MGNVENITSGCDFYCSRSRQKLTAWLKQILKTRKLTTSFMSSSIVSLNYTIPMISIIFLTIIAVSSIIRVNSNYTREEQTTAQTSLFLAKSMEIIFEKTNIKFTSEYREQIETLLKRFLLNSQLLTENLILITQSDGIIIASSIEKSPYIGEKIGEVIPINNISNSIKISEDFIEKAPYHILPIHLEKNNGFVIVASSQLPLLNFWRNEVNAAVTFFSSVSAILLFILFNHYKQAKRIKETNDVLLKANTCIETALSRGRCGIWNFNFISKKFHFSHSMCEMIGIPYSDKALSFSRIARIIHSEDKTIYNIIRSIAKGEPSQLDQVFRICHSSGTYIWIRARAQIMHTPSGGINVIGIAMDITEQYDLEKRYAEADQRLAKAIECTSEAFALWDKDDRLIMCNIHYQQAYGLSDNVLLPGTKRSTVKAAETHPIIEYYTSNPENSQYITKEIKLEDSRWLQINEWRTHEGGTVSVGTDITQLKRNQKKLRESERRLMATINDLSTSRQILERQKTELSIANSKYQAEKDRAEQANRAKSEFLAKMSHELRTPLNAILGFSEIIKGELFGELGSVKYYEYAKDIHDSGKHLLNLINDILEMSKIEAEHIHINKKNINLEPIINESIQCITTHAQNKNIEIEEKISHQLPFNADERIIKQILLHIFSNSIKFTDKGGKIIVRTSQIGEYTIITVADTGIGIPKESLEKVGKPFEQLQNQHALNKGGSGLGLAISYALTKLHGGRLKIISQEGKGTIVTICIPT